MQTIRLKGNETPVFLSKIILGTGAFGTSIPAEEAFRMLDRYLELGGSTLDTARVYGTWGPPAVRSARRQSAHGCAAAAAAAVSPSSPKAAIRR